MTRKTIYYAVTVAIILLLLLALSGCEAEKKECSADADCPEIRCFKAPCPQNVCERGVCTFVVKTESASPPSLPK